MKRTHSLRALALMLLVAVMMFSIVTVLPKAAYASQAPTAEENAAPAAGEAATQDSAATEAPAAEKDTSPTPKPTLFQQISKNAGFVLTALAITAVVAGIAIFLQRLIFKNRAPKVNRTRRITYTALFSSMAAILMLIEFPLMFIAPNFYKIDLSEIPIMICTFFLGPAYGVVAEFIKVAIHVIIKGTSTAFVGDFANFIIGSTFVLPASIIYHAKPTRRNAVIGLVAGTLVMTFFGSFLNAVYLLPKYAEMYHAPIDYFIAEGTKINGRITNVASFVALAVAPFNLIKGALVSVVTYYIYKPISDALKMESRKYKSQNKSEGSTKKQAEDQTKTQPKDQLKNQL